MRILIIEDDSETRDFVARGLRELGHSVTDAAEGRDGLFQATDGGFDAIVVDRMLPGLDGLSLVKMLRATGNVTPVLMLTAIGRIELIRPQASATALSIPRTRPSKADVTSISQRSKASALALSRDRASSIPLRISPSTSVLR